MNSGTILSISLIFSLVFTGQLRAECRFWAAIADRIPAEVTLNQLYEAPESLRELSKKNNDGWGIGYYDGRNNPVLLKGSREALLDKGYGAAVKEVAYLEPGIIVAHVRKATSGCLHNVPNPHPFQRERFGKQWLFGHNGAAGKSKLIELIGGDYLKKNPPHTCAYDPPNSWVDSELYFIFLLKRIEDNGRDVEKGIKAAVVELNAANPGEKLSLNFFLTDGDILWAFRQGRSLYYYYQPELKYSVVASAVPFKAQGEWVEVPEGSLLIMQPGVSPELKSIMRL